MNRNKKLWRNLSIVFSAFLALFIAANILGHIFATTINWVFNTAQETFTVTGVPGEIFFKSEFTEKDSSGKTKLNSKGLEIYDSASLQAAGDSLVKNVTAEGFTLLKNNGALPLAKNTRVSLFGQAVDSPLTSGTGSGQTAGNTTTFKMALEAGGLIVNEDSYNYYTTGEGRQYRGSIPGMHDANPFRINECPWSVVSASSAFSRMIDCDTAVYDISRNGGEGFDLANGASVVGYDFGEIICADARKKENGSLSGNNYLELNEDERSVLAGLKSLKDAGTINNIVVVLNSANPVQLDFLEPSVCGVDYGIDACLWLGATGQSGLASLGPLLTGDVVPSGRTVDTLLYDNLKEPSIYNFGHNVYMNYEDSHRSKANSEGREVHLNQKYYTVYREGIYIGYRYFETRYEDTVLGQDSGFDYGKTVAYSFGHGLSYAEFEYSGFTVTDNADGTMTAEVSVKNVSSFTGKEVVQIYAQAPYTEYDRESGIEKSSIVLVGFEKTKALAPGETEKVSVKFTKERLTSYDAYNAKTYIMDAGDYYIAAGNGAHDALNAILLEKGADPGKLVPASSTLRFSDGKRTHKFNISERDVSTYSVSSSTGVNITNRFDHADLNLYENGAQPVTYVSRKNWAGTFDVTSLETMKQTAVKLNMTDGMYNEVKNEQYSPPPEAANAVMPTLGAKNGLRLIMFRGVPKDGAIEVGGMEYTWDDLLDQVSFKDMRDLIAQGQHTTRGISSVAKPATSDQNGPLGFSTTFVGGGSGTSYPSPCLRAATFNKQLVRRVGELIGEDGLHSQCNGLLGPGANTHRNTFCGRVFEYYSEDPCLSGLIGAEECRGIQSKGIIVYEKHFALNDSETHREGVGTWAAEQAVREIYLEAFREIMKIDGGNAHACMSAFNRLGTIWAGNSTGLMEDVLRGEWGFDGFIVTDADACDTTTHCTQYMYAPRAITTGTDIFDGVNNHSRDAQMNAYSKDPYVVSCMRRATFRILYSVANSAAMNGIGWSATVTASLPWWQALLVSLTVIFGVLAAGSWVMFALSLKGIILFGGKRKTLDAGDGGNNANKE